MALSFASQIVRGKTLGRVIFNKQVQKHTSGLQGKILDLAGGGSYLDLLPRDTELTVTNLNPELGAVVDFNLPLPYEDKSFDHVLFFQALYIAEDPLTTLAEIRRIVRPDGSVLIASPFLQNEMREPHDYNRLTSEGLARLFRQAGFRHFEIEPYGERFSVGVNLMHPFLLFGALRLPFYALAFGLDRLIPHRLRERHPAPLGWFCKLYN